MLCEQPAMVVKNPATADYAAQVFVEKGNYGNNDNMYIPD